MRISRRLIDITGLRDIIQRRIPVLVAESRRPGPVVWVTACIHGDEVGGTAIVHDVFAKLRKQGLSKGAVHAFPLINSMGFENVSRYLNIDREDLNRCFPGNPRGSMGEQIARRLYDTILKSSPALVIDIHNDWVQSIPHILLDPLEAFPNNKIARRTRELARAAGLLLVEDSDVFHPLRNTLAGAVLDAGVPAYTIEAGGAYAVVEAGVAAGTSAVLSTLQAMGMIEWFLPVGSQAGQEPLRYTNRPLCSTSGLIRFRVRPGEEIREGQLLAEVFSAFGSREESLLATADGFVLGLEDHARVLPGREVIAIAERH
ncbi:MAG TPA: succinylglutamate desuccinylase/aspartoacylase family protein [Steroidobacteraceae bacterium]|nr:succinylglutamate desuccinylase/aspartoacylase family protein [Steroidobacteraceae bacterium]